MQKIIVKILKRYLSISLLFLFLYNSIGHFLLLGGTLRVWKHEVKSSIIAKTKESDLVKISVSEKIRLLDEGKELEFDGKRYDIIKKNATHYFCFQDDKETHLITKVIGSLVQKASNNNDDYSIFKNILKVYFIENQAFIFMKMIFMKIYLMPSFMLSSNYFPVFFIPPKK